MNERIFIAMGGSAHRLEANKTLVNWVEEEVPKALLELGMWVPKPPVKPIIDRVLDRHLRMLPKELPVTLCTGFRAELVKELYPEYDQIITYDPDDPVGILCCFKDILKYYKKHPLHHYEYGSLTFLLGDTVWSNEAMKEALNRRHEAPITFYASRPKAPCEVYMATFSGVGIDIMRKLMVEREFVTDPPLEPWPTFILRGGKIWLLIRWLDQQGLLKDERRMIQASHPVDDFDLDADKVKVWKRYEEGYYGER